MGERDVIIKTMHRDLTAAGVHRAAGDQVIFNGQASVAPGIGRLIAEGVSDELHDRRYVIVDGIRAPSDHAGGEPDAGLLQL